MPRRRWVHRRSHVGRILAKLELRDRVQIVVFAYDNGLVSPGA
jgi:DNA-binding NarL/FixJ family response regulator